MNFNSVYNSIKEKIKIFEICSSIVNDFYQLVVVCNSEEIFYLHQKMWYKDHLNLSDFKDFIKYLICTNFMIDLIVYKKITEVITVENDKNIENFAKIEKFYEKHDKNIENFAKIENFYEKHEQNSSKIEKSYENS